MEELQAVDAARLLHDVPEPGKEATTRVVGLTWMIWGYAFAAGLLATGLALAPNGAWSLESEIAAWGLGAAAPVLLAAFVTARLWRAHGVLPEGRPGLELGLYAAATIVVGWLVLWPLAFISLATNEIIYATTGASFEYGVKGMGGLVAVAIWTFAFGRTRWNPAAPGRRAAKWLGALLLVATVPLGLLARNEGTGFAMATIIGAFIVMLAFTLVGSLLYSEG